jgi:hypothetical protein
MALATKQDFRLKYLADNILKQKTQALAACVS